MNTFKIILAMALVVTTGHAQATFWSQTSLRDFMTPPSVVSVAPDSGWHIFNVSDPALELSNNRPDDWREIIDFYGSGRSDFYWDKIFQFQLDRPALLTVVDVFSAIDRYDVYDNANPSSFDGYSYLFTTNYPDYYDGAGGTQDPDVVLSGDPNEHQSFGSILLTPGFHSITGWEINHDVLISPSNGATGYIRIDSVPEPSIIALLLIGFIGIFKSNKAY